MRRFFCCADSFVLAVALVAPIPQLFAGSPSEDSPYVSALLDTERVAKPAPPCGEMVCTEDPFTHRFVCDATPEQFNCTMKRGSLSCRSSAC